MSRAATESGCQIAPFAGQSLTFGRPLTDNINETLSFQDFELGDPSESQVLIKFLAAPINPIDIHVLAGRYPVRPRNSINSELIPGFDGVARVLRVGSAVKDFKEGNLVVTRSHGLGTWRTHALTGAGDLIKIKWGANIVFASMLKTVILPAYLLVEDMKSLEKGDWIIQNAGTSAIAQMVAQFARLKGVRTISVIRDRPDDASSRETETALAQFSDVVLEEKDFIPAEVASGKKIVLALDSVWGDSARQIATAMGDGAMFVNYGNFDGRGPDSGINLTLRDLFFKGAIFRSFKTTAQAATRDEEEVAELLGWFVELFEAKKIRLPRYREVEWDPDAVESVIGAVRSVVKMDRNSSKPILIFE